MNKDRAEQYAQEILNKMVELEVNMIVSHHKDHDLKMQETAQNVGKFYQYLVQAYTTED